MSDTSSEYEIKMIAARDKNGVIGKDGDIPWHYPRDMAHFKNTTMNETVVMGRKTYESPGWYPEREVIVVTTTRDYPNESAITVDSPEKAIEQASNDTIWICGGQGLYERFMGDAKELVISEIPENVENGDTFFPEITDNYTLSESRSMEDFLIRRYELE
jgi:dihydrofolate reductase